MITVKELIRYLKGYPKDACCYAYKNEDIGIRVYDPQTNKHAFISATSSIEEDVQTEEIYFK